MSHQCHAYLARTSHFYDLFEGGRVPIKAPLPAERELEGQGTQAVYFIDASALTPAQLDSLVQRVADIFHTDVDDVRAELIEKGLPLRATQTTAVSIPLAFVL